MCAITLANTINPFGDGLADIPWNDDEAVPDERHARPVDPSLSPSGIEVDRKTLQARVVAAGSQQVRIYGTDGDDRLTGTPGEDVIVGAGGSDRIDGGAGNDRPVGGDGADLLLGGGGADSLFGGAGSDTLNAALGDAIIDGGDGVDHAILDWTAAAAAAEIDLAEPAGPQTLGNGAVMVRIEAMTMHAGSGNDTIKGGALADVIFGGDGRDYIEGRAGDNLLDGGAGADTLVGGAGSDTLRAGDGDDSLSDDTVGINVLDGGAGIDFAGLDRHATSEAILFRFISGGDQTLSDGTRLISIEEIALIAGTGDDTISGGDLRDFLNGGSGMTCCMGAAAWISSSATARRW